MHNLNSHEAHRRARVLRARAMQAGVRNLARAVGRWWRRLGAVGRALGLAG